ncbi:DVU_1556 family methyltransferase [Acetobacterium sp.]|uniref:DVU_1556 family methyltransferase n=1 Tax=Acetobacterium sp. TaxID=1872094 RepID=UPI000CBEAB57|nr:class I SAM-dependent methyltransferase [Acetobacterium sp.]MDO9493235.1 methyltransferase domain-containing protein [Acetobacterium sp.]PKM74984.1 MAG: SAM-dependent methyltransferase [Firmicutes bacterium HGW-Firmicutes-17]
MSGNCAYESPQMTELLGETLRPGGFDLTDKGVACCHWTSADLLLDLGCGQGATVRYLDQTHGLNAVGIDPSHKLLAMARKNNPDKSFLIGSGEAIPFQDDLFQGVLSECTLSLMTDMTAALKEVYRVMKNNGTFFITDVYARNPESLEAMKTHEFESCMRGLYDLKQVQIDVESAGFEIILLEDHSELLKQLLVKTIFEFGSMNAFWQKTGGACATGFQETLKMCKPGYYMMIARKAE